MWPISIVLPKYTNWKNAELNRKKVQFVSSERPPAPSTPYRNCNTCFYQQIVLMLIESEFDRSSLQNRRVSFFYFRFSFRIFSFWAFEVISNINSTARNIPQLSLYQQPKSNIKFVRMELWQLVLDKYGQEGCCPSVSLSYNPIGSISLLPTPFTLITSLTLNHCDLSSLQGLEQFPHLEEFSFKFNNITSAKELDRLRCGDSLRSLNFVGNDIEYLESCRYEKLVKRFQKLVELNNVDHRFKEVLKIQKKGKVETHKIMEKLEKLDQMTKRHNTTSPGEEETHKKENAHPDNLENISISRVQMIKSVVKEPEPAQKKRNLLISTANVENIQVYQPTATFARQKTIESTAQGFPFRKETTNLMELLDRRDDQDLCISRNSFTGIAFGGNSMVLFPDLKVQLDDYAEDLADTHYNKHLVRKVFSSWTQSRNLPRRREFY